ncbi:anti-phage deoxyguanosine triphosphatase [Kordiimonas sp. SCSIO 12610]|uniref:anti-phage deoxyguanosine triphosphatase n=1 Tax=Kordiimonas sp. SCSIO 12610 TaxID=2829597 RepID=UPI00210A3022|nr:anti-phage deoxyguanosine triphosphatase [Kordiimonas sp. SCSIO 12610]UTW54616.1 dGTPase [Kordiimonas sp. SCSIO 12610]
MNKWEQRRDGWKPGEGDARNSWDVDYGRIIHSASFRRLQSKTQILNLGDGDFYRTRLTHSLEVAQIASGLTKQLAFDNLDNSELKDVLPEEKLIQTIAMTHDLGHPPFGHGGEIALNYCMREHGGFEGNGQTLRILSKLEKMSKNDGANLSRRTLLGVLKYPVPYSAVKNRQIHPSMINGDKPLKLLDKNSSKPPKCYHDTEQDIVNWIMEPLSEKDRLQFVAFDPVVGKHAKSKHKSFDCSIMDLADEISYGVHDFEDAITLGMLTEQHFRKYVSAEDCAPFIEFAARRNSQELDNDQYEGLIKLLFNNGSKRKKYINLLVGYFIQNVQFIRIEEFAEPLIQYRAVLRKGDRKLLDSLIEIVKHKMILSAEVQHLEFRGQMMVLKVFDVLTSDPYCYLPEDIFEKYIDQNKNPRIVCDYIAGMTDNHLVKIYNRLFSPNEGSVFEKI